MPNVVSSAKFAARLPEKRAADSGLRVGGLVAFSATDYLDALSAVVFAQGCPWRCGYCHNPHLLAAKRAGNPTWPDVLAWLGERRGLLDAVVFSGGEPLAQTSLADAIREVGSLGFKVGLHTGGAYPRRLVDVLPLVDWVGLDVKAARSDYETVTATAGSGDAAFASLELILRSGVDYEVRTTVHPRLTPVQALVRISAELAASGVGRWVLQRFRAQGCADVRLTATHDDLLDELLLQALRRHIPVIDVR